MLPTVPVPPRRVDDLIEPAGEEAVERLRDAARALHGARILQVNSTAFGGGVAELLTTQVALLNDLGLETTWQVIDGSDDFFAVTKLVHNGLQGAEVPWTQEMVDVYMDRCRANAAQLARGYDFVVIHDPQPAGILTVLEEEGSREGRWLWRCHIDLSNSHEPVWDYFAGHVRRHDGAVFTMHDFVRPGLGDIPVFEIPPSIDPLSPKNMAMTDAMVGEIVGDYGVDIERPIITQVSRFDPWKDPLGVIDAYRLVKRAVPGVQLVMIASFANDDPEGMHYLNLTEEHREGDPDVFLLSNLTGVGDLEVNAFQRASAVVVQKSLREGFGLVVAEGMWKERPVVGGAVGGIRLQIEDGGTGFLVASVERCAERILQLLRDPGEAERMGRKGRDRVRERFLTPRELEDQLRALASIAG